MIPWPSSRPATVIRTLSSGFDEVDRDDHSFAALREAMKRLPTAHVKDGLAKDVTAVQTSGSFLNPHAAPSAHQGDYKWLAQVYEAVKPTSIGRSAMAPTGGKWLALVHGHLSSVLDMVSRTGARGLVGRGTDTIPPPSD